MGYHSQVLLIVGKGAMPLFLDALATTPKAKELCFTHCDHFEKDYKEVGSMLFNWEWLKWYDSYEDVQAIKGFMDLCDDEGLDNHFRFVRMGEDVNDVEERGHYAWNDAGVCRSIHW